MLELMERDYEWAASALCFAETRITLCHLGFDDEALADLTDALERDWDGFFVVPVDELCLAEAVDIGCSRRVRTLDAVHLAAASRLPGAPTFVTFDERQREAAESLGLALAAD